jgi:hypothetical protein
MTSHSNDDLRFIQRKQLLPAVKKWSCPATCHGGTWRERRYSSYSFLTSAPDGGDYKNKFVNKKCRYLCISTTYRWTIDWHCCVARILIVKCTFLGCYSRNVTFICNYNLKSCKFKRFKLQMDFVCNMGVVCVCQHNPTNPCIPFTVLISRLRKKFLWYLN